MAITEDLLVRLRVQGQQQFATAMGGAAMQTGKLGTASATTGKQVDASSKKAKAAERPHEEFCRVGGRGRRRRRRLLRRAGGRARVDRQCRRPRRADQQNGRRVSRARREVGARLVEDDRHRDRHIAARRARGGGHVREHARADGARPRRGGQDVERDGRPRRGHGLLQQRNTRRDTRGDQGRYQRRDGATAPLRRQAVAGAHRAGGNERKAVGWQEAARRSRPRARHAIADPEGHEGRAGRL